MRFLHLSDLHLGKRVCEFSMLDDQRYILEQIFSLLDSTPVDGVLLAGDLYDKPVPPAEAVRLLEESGYPCHSAGQCVACLIRRLRESEEFPHEIGLFLSYPPEDVRGFIENKACRFKCAGLWKVYGDEERAKELFRQYKRCTDRCCALWRAGSGLAQLAV